MDTVSADLAYLVEEAPIIHKEEKENNLVAV